MPATVRQQGYFFLYGAKKACALRRCLYLHAMTEFDPLTHPIVFLHLPKTGGQTIHHAVGAHVGSANISPYRLHVQTKGKTSFPPEYRMHSGHLHWTELDSIPGNPFSFMVLRDPRERLGSFFFFMREEARKNRDANGEDKLPLVHRALLQSASSVFFSNDPQVRDMIEEHWANLTVTYLATRTLRRRGPMKALSLDELLTRAEENSRALTAIYRFGEFDKIEADLEPILGARPEIATKRANPGPLDPSRSRWQALLEELDSDAERHQMSRFVDEDDALMQRIAFR